MVQSFGIIIPMDLIDTVYSGMKSMYEEKYRIQLTDANTVIFF